MSPCSRTDVPGFNDDCRKIPFSSTLRVSLDLCLSFFFPNISLHREDNTKTWITHKTWITERAPQDITKRRAARGARGIIFLYMGYYGDEASDIM